MGTETFQGGGAPREQTSGPDWEAVTFLASIKKATHVPVLALLNW